MKERLFRFKHFSVAHEVSAMKVGVDGVLIGLWAQLPSEGYVLDAGAGCGVISLILAQRSAVLKIFGVEYDPGAADEASMNFHRSPWSERLSAHCADWIEYARSAAPFDMIVSNPPFFQDGVEAGNNLRLSARHAGRLSPTSLLSHAAEFLSAEGDIAMIFPAEHKDRLMAEAEGYGLYVRRIAFVSHHAGAEVKRIMVQWSRKETDSEVSHLVLFEDDKVTPTAEYQVLGGDFYLKF